MKALIFDMDGTLTQSAQPISLEMMDAISKIATSYKKYLVTGSDFVKVEKQIPERFLLNHFNRVFTCNGTRVYNTNLDYDVEGVGLQPELIHKIELLDHYSQADMNHIISYLLKLASESHTKFKTGTFVEWRGSQINFSVVGRNCSTDQREDYVRWDQKSGERQKMAEKLRKEFEGWGLAFNLGGQISLDITRKEWDKTYALNFITESPANCTFFGDRIMPGGNDYKIARTCKQYHSVDGPEDTLTILEQYK